jgi:hypothetical protein
MIIVDCVPCLQALKQRSQGIIQDQAHEVVDHK